MEASFTGSAKLGKWKHIPAEQAHGDNAFREEPLVNTTRYISPGTPPRIGLSLVEGTDRTPQEMIAKIPRDFWARASALPLAGNAMCCARLGMLPVGSFCRTTPPVILPAAAKDLRLSAGNAEALIIRPGLGDSPVEEPVSMHKNQLP